MKLFKNNIETREFYSDLMKVVIPIGLQNLSEQAILMVQNIMIGRMGDLIISMASICGNYLWFGTTIINGIAGGVILVGSQEYGKGNMKAIKQLFSICFLSAVLVGTAYFSLTVFIPEQIMKLYTENMDIVRMGTEYFKISKYSIICSMLSLAISLSFRSIMKARLGFINSFITCVTNIFFIIVFVFQLEMGVQGLAYAYLTGKMIELLISLIYLFTDRDLHFRVKDFDINLDKDLLKLLFSKILSITAIELLHSISVTVQTMITGRISDFYLAANSIVHVSYSIPSVFAGGCGVAANTMIGKCLGNREYDKAKLYSRRFIVISLLMGLFASAMVHVMMLVLPGFYNVSADTLMLAKRMSISASFVVVFLSVGQTAENGILRSGGMTEIVLVMDAVFTWLFAIPAGYIGAVIMHLDPIFLYVLFRFDYILKAVWGLKKVLSNDNWMRTIV